jgi:hypothetical protein
MSRRSALFPIQTQAGLSNSQVERCAARRPRVLVIRQTADVVVEVIKDVIEQPLIFEYWVCP